MKKHYLPNNRSFTLIELLVVLALVAILSVVVVMTLNPAELIKQARDSNRLSDLSTINTALNLFSADVTSGFMGTSTVVYVSIPDNASSTCGSLGLPALPAGNTYNCVTTANLRKTDGTGWIPVNFQRISSNSPISQLPIDPQNTTSTGNYYTYVSGGSWMLTAIPESVKQKAELSANPHITNYPGAIGVGNNLSLSPLFNSTGLVGYWKFDEGSGSIAKDSSGKGNNGMWSGAGARYATGKVGAWGAKFNGTNDYIDAGAGTSLNLTSSGTIMFWHKVDSWLNTYDDIISKGTINGWCGNAPRSPLTIFNHYSGDMLAFAICDASLQNALTIVPRPSTGTWHFYTFIFNGSQTILYLDGQYVTSAGQNISSILQEGNLYFSYPIFSNAYLDDLRIYNRGLSASEVKAIYGATR